MCHLAIEKALKGFYVQSRNLDPPRTHSLTLLLEKGGFEFPLRLHRFVVLLNQVSVPTRYPDDLRRLLRVYSKTKTRGIVARSREVVRWIGNKSGKS